MSNETPDTVADNASQPLAEDATHAGHAVAQDDTADVVAQDDAAFDRMVSQRSDLRSEERDAGSADPGEQARLIMEDSELRALERELAPTTSGERRTSEETTPPVDLAPE